MNVMTILGTRPEVIRLSRVIERLDKDASHTLVHTGQNYNPRLNDIFFTDLRIRKPDVYMGIHAENFGEQIGEILRRSEELFRKHRPERLLVLGDTNSGIAALAAKRLGIAVYHMEAGNRCYDDRVPEEVNRRVIDHCSSVLLPYTQRSRENLLREGIPAQCIYVTGNPIKEVIDHYASEISASTVLDQLKIYPLKYFLVTIHRAENVDNEDRLSTILLALQRLNDKYALPVICSLHPRTRSKIEAFGIHHSGIRFLEPFGFFDFVKLEQSAFCVLTDSGTVQEETCIFGVPNVTIRDVTERPETIECGSNVLTGADVDGVLSLVEMVTANKRQWTPPAEYLVSDVADTVCRIVLGYRTATLSQQAWIAAGVETA